MKQALLLMCALLTALGCSHTTGTQPGAKPEQYCLRYKSWSGVSPGAGFLHTRLMVVDLDLGQRKTRKLMQVAKHPAPMLPHDDAGIAKLLDGAPSRDLSPDEVARFGKLIRAWLATSPPPTYNSPAALGCEDGYLAQLSVSWGTKSVMTKVNPRGGFSPDDPLRPPKEWQELLDSLFGGRPGVVGPIGEFQPVRK